MLEAFVKRVLQPLEGAPFRFIVKAVTGCEILNFNASDARDTKLLEKLKKAAGLAGKLANDEGLWSRRPNEVGNRIEPFVKRALAEMGLEVSEPRTRGGRAKAGYPDIKVVDDSRRTLYLECKTYEPGKEHQTFRTFYWKVSKDTKVTDDAFHFVLTYSREATRELRPVEDDESKTEGRYRFLGWRLFTLENLKVSLKPEFFASNRQMYSPEALLAEGEVQP